MRSDEFLRWKEGLYCFDDTPLDDLLSRLEKYYNVKFIVKNKEVLNYKCTGKFKEQDGVEHVLRVIQKDNPFKYTVQEDGKTIIIE